MRLIRVAFPKYMERTSKYNNAVVEVNNKKYIPEVDETKGSIELVVEVLAQLFIMLIGVFYVHRLVTFLPSYAAGIRGFSELLRH